MTRATSSSQTLSNSIQPIPAVLNPRPQKSPLIPFHGAPIIPSSDPPSRGSSRVPQAPWHQSGSALPCGQFGRFGERVAVDKNKNTPAMIPWSGRVGNTSLIHGMQNVCVQYRYILENQSPQASSRSQKVRNGMSWYSKTGVLPPTLEYRDRCGWIRRLWWNHV